MDFIEKLQGLQKRTAKKEVLFGNEEATKNALIMPFLQALGYDVFNPEEVEPEFTADVLEKKGEKVDYAIKIDGKIVMIVECKPCGTQLDTVKASQLYRYFTATESRIGVLTDGIVYNFYSDLEQPNIMDSRPFMVLNLEDFDEATAQELKKLSKNNFDLETTLSSASELKYTREIKMVLLKELDSPSADFVKLLTGSVYNGRMTQAVVLQFTDIVKTAYKSLIDDKITSRLKFAMTENKREEQDVEMTQNANEKEIVTTDLELEAFYIVKAIASEVVEPEKVFLRDGKSYCSIIYDDNNRNPICKLYFGAKKMVLGLFDKDKKETRVEIQTCNEIFKQAGKIKDVVMLYKERVN